MRAAERGDVPKRPRDGIDGPDVERYAKNGVGRNPPTHFRFRYATSTGSIIGARSTSAVRVCLSV